MVENKTVFAVDIGGSKLLCGFVSSDGRIIDTEKYTLEKNISTDKLESYILSAFSALKKRNNALQISSCGITIPGVADFQNGMWIYACFSGINNYPISERMSRLLELPVFIENDANANAWGEKLFGCCKGCEDYIWVTISNSVGSGLVLGGNLYRGSGLGAGEIGHLVIEKEKPLICPCGHSGCLEAMAAGPAISARYEMLTGKRISALEISSLARAGNEAALNVIKKTAFYIGSALGKTASLLNLQKYVLGGGVMQSFDLMENDIIDAFKKEAFAAPNQNVIITKTYLGYEAGLMGAAAIAIEVPN